MSRSKARESETDDLEIAVGGEFYPLRVRRSPRARSIIVSADTVKGEVRLTMPRFASQAQALRFAQSKSDWLATCFAEAHPAVPIVDGAEIAFAGETHVISWSPEYARMPERGGGEIRVGGPEDRIAYRITSWMRDRARQVYAEDLAFYCERAAVDLPKLSVGDARRRWGSCSGKKAIRLNWRLIMAPPMVRRSVVAHEVAHLRHMNHSSAFYDLLDKIFEGDRKDADRWLKSHGSDLHLIGA